MITSARSSALALVGALLASALPSIWPCPAVPGPVSGAVSGPVGVDERTESEAPRLKEERMVLELTATSGEATLIVEAESEGGLERVEVRSPRGESLLRLRSAEGRDVALQGFVIETRETSVESILSTFPEGRYDLRAWTTDGDSVRGAARFAHALPRAPEVLYPYDEAVNVPTNLTVGWKPDPEAVRYQVILEQNENDGLTVNLPAGSDAFHVPPGVLAPGTESLLEVGAIGANGNRTLVEVRFTTR